MKKKIIVCGAVGFIARHEFVCMVEIGAGIKLRRSYNLKAPKGENAFRSRRGLGEG